jgi:sorbitol/mannitol transport system permease protein
VVITTEEDEVQRTKLGRRSQHGSLRPRGLLIPALAFLISITQIPFFVTLYLSVRSWNLLRPDQGQHFVGFKNFIDLIHIEPSVVRSVATTLVLTISVVILSTLLGISLAIWLNHKFAGRAVVRTLLLTPMLLMPVIVGQIWGRIFFDPGNGLVPWAANHFFSIRFTPLSQFPLATVIFISVWEWTPFAYLILTSGLNALDVSTLEAAKVDGANRRQLFKYVTFPHLTSYLNITLLLGTVLILPTFGVIYSTTAGGPGYSTTNLSLAVYQQLFLKYSVGGASALALLNVILVIFAMTGLVKLLGNILVRNEVMA